MARSNLCIRPVLLLAFAAILVCGEEKTRHNLSKELGLTPSCVKRVLATCASSLPRSVLHAPEERSYCDSPQTESLVEALKETSSGQKALLQFLKEWLGTNTEHEKSLREVKSDVQSLEEVVSDSVTTLQTVNETVTSLSTDFQKMKSTTMDNTSALQEEALREMADRLRLLEDSVKTNALEFQKMEEKRTHHHNTKMEELQDHLTKVEEKRTQHHNTKMEELQDHLTKIEEKLDSDTKRQDLLLDMMKSFEVLLPVPHNCADLLGQGDTESGVRTVYPYSCSKCRPVSVFCDQTNTGGGWTVIQRRDALPKREDFYRNWEDYRLGFGDMEGEFWLGLDNIHALVSGTPMELRVDLEDFDGQKRWAQYDAFFIEDAADKYRLNLGNFSGDAGDSMTDNSGEQFSTKDQDNDSWLSRSCAQVRQSGWWHDKCTNSNLNGLALEGEYESSNKEGIFWSKFRGYYYSLKRVTMKVRPRTGN